MTENDKTPIDLAQEFDKAVNTIKAGNNGPESDALLDATSAAMWAVARSAIADAEPRRTAEVMERIAMGGLMAAATVAGALVAAKKVRSAVH